MWKGINSLVFLLILCQVFEILEVGLGGEPSSVKDTLPSTPKPRERNEDNLIHEIEILITLIVLLALLFYVQKCLERLPKKLSEESQERQDAAEVTIE